VDMYERWRRREPSRHARAGHRGSDPMYLNRDPECCPPGQLPTNRPTESTSHPARASVAEESAP
jgi:hypothetical protein